MTENRNNIFFFHLTIAICVNMVYYLKYLAYLLGDAAPPVGLLKVILNSPSSSEVPVT